MNSSDTDFPAFQLRIARPTNKIAAVEDFYVKGLGFKKIGSFEKHNGYDGIMLGIPGESYHLEFTQCDHVMPCIAPTRDNLLVFYFKTENELELIKQRIESMGVEAVEPENPYWKNKSYTYEDPEGWRIVLFNGLYGR